MPDTWVVMTSSGSGLFGNAGQGDYAAAKGGVAALALVGYLASPACRFSGHVFGVIGGRVVHYDGFSEAARVDAGRRWHDGELDDALADWDASIPPVPEA